MPRLTFGNEHAGDDASLGHPVTEHGSIGGPVDIPLSVPDQVFLRGDFGHLSTLSNGGRMADLSLTVKKKGVDEHLLRRRAKTPLLTA